MRQKIPLIVLFFLILIMAVVWANALKKTRSSGPVKETNAKITSQDTKAAAFWGEKSEKARKRSTYKNWGRDPFTPAKEITSLMDLNLMGILWDEANPQAIINDKIVKINDTIDNNRVIEIKKNSVTLTDGRNKIELKLWNESDSQNKNQ